MEELRDGVGLVLLPTTCSLRARLHLLLNNLHRSRLRLHVAADLGGVRLALPIEELVQEVVRDVEVLLLLVLEEEAGELVECFPETLDNLMRLETILGRVVDDVEWVEDHEVGLGGAMLIEGSREGRVLEKKMH